MRQYADLEYKSTKLLLPLINSAVVTRSPGILVHWIFSSLCLFLVFFSSGTGTSHATTVPQDLFNGFIQHSPAVLSFFSRHQQDSFLLQSPKIFGFLSTRRISDSIDTPKKYLLPGHSPRIFIFHSTVLCRLIVFITPSLHNQRIITTQRIT
jgi:hypothetical protein